MLNHINKIKSERYYNTEQKFNEEIKPILDSINAIWDTLHLSTLKVHPYGYEYPFSEIYNDMFHWNLCTVSSRCLLISEFNGCIDILNSKIDNANEPQVTVRYLSGKKIGMIVSIAESIAKELIDMDLAVLA